jgi:hypothetical protein
MIKLALLFCRDFIFNENINVRNQFGNFMTHNVRSDKKENIIEVLNPRKEI